MPAGRPRKSIRLHAVSGQIEKNPKRFRERLGEPLVEAPLGDPPANWLPHPQASAAAELFAQGKSSNEVAAALGIDWESVCVMRGPEMRDRAALLDAWQRLSLDIAQLPAGTVTAADRLAVQLACRLLVRVESANARPGDFTNLRNALADLCLNARGRAARGGKAAGNSDESDFDEFRHSGRRIA